MKKKLFSEIPYLTGKRLTLRGLTAADAAALQELVESPNVYRFLPAFLFEKKYEDVHTVIARLYDECRKDSIILGIFRDDGFCGLAELYGYRDDLHKVSVGIRLLERCWGAGIAAEAIGLLVDYLYAETDNEIIAASTMSDNPGPARALRKNGFSLVVRANDEDWGYGAPTPTDKWIR